MTDNTPSPVPLLLAELLGASVTGHVMHALALLPGWAGGILGGLVVHIIGRLLAPTLDEHGQRIKRWTGRFRALARPSKPPAAPPPPDDHDASG